MKRAGFLHHQLLLAAILSSFAISLIAVAPEADAEAQTAAAANIAIDVPQLLNSGALTGRKLIFAGWGGVQTAATMKNFVLPFQEATGVQVTMVAPGGGFAAKLAAQEQASNVQWDLIDGPGSDGDILASMGYVENFPPSLLAALAPLVRSEELVEPWRLRYGQAPYLIACNPAVMKKCPTNPQEFWDTANFPGPRGIAIGTPVKTLTIAEEAAGVPREKLFPLDIPLAIAALQKIKSFVKVWAETPSQSEQVLADGEVGVEIITNGRANDLKRDMPALQISWQGAAVDPDGWVVPKGAANADVAFAFILWVAEHPKNQAGWTETMFNLTPAKNLADLLSPAVRDETAIFHNPVQIPHETIVAQQKQIREGMQQLLYGR